MLTIIEKFVATEIWLNLFLPSLYLADWYVHGTYRLWYMVPRYMVFTADPPSWVLLFQTQQMLDINEILW
jgi:hypothetical protein